MMLKSFQSNWIPVPQPKGLITKAEKEIDAGLFPLGEVTYFLPHLKRGTIKTKSGALVPFDVNLLDRFDHHSANNMRVGSKVGYDLSETQKGKRITKLKVF